MNNPLYYLTGILAPDLCLGCRVEADGPLCASCRLKLPTLPGNCFYCGRPSWHSRTCDRCQPKTSLLAIAARTSYQEPLAQKLLWKLKSDRSQAAAGSVAKCLLTCLPDLAKLTTIVPVPTANRRVRARGYDQSVLIAKHLAKLTGLPCRQVLARLHSAEQKGAGRQQRFAQQQASLIVIKPQVIRNNRVLLVDDVVTTGATLEAAAAALHGAGVTKISAVVFAAA